MLQKSAQTQYMLLHVTIFSLILLLLKILYLLIIDFNLLLLILFCFFFIFISVKYLLEGNFDIFFFIILFYMY